MVDTNSQSNCIERIRKILKLRSNECMLKDGSIVIKPEKEKEKLVIEVNISRILKICNSKRFKFINCVFKKPIKLQQITFKNILYFINSTFEEEVDFSRSLFKKRRSSPNLLLTTKRLLRRSFLNKMCILMRQGFWGKQILA